MKRQSSSISRVPLHSIARHHSGNSKLIKGKLLSESADDLYPAFSASGQDVWRREFEHEGNAIIVSAVGARCGKCFLASGKWSAIANTHVVWPDESRVDRKLLWYLLNDEKFWVRSGSAQPFVVVRKTLEKEIDLPPLNEQRRIVAEIEKQFTRLDAGVAALRRVQANLKRYRAAVLKAACEGRLVPTEAEIAKNQGRTFETGEQLLQRVLAERHMRWAGRGKYKEPTAPDDSAITTRTPVGWAIASVDQLSGHITSGSRDWSQFYGRGSGTFILAQNVRPMRLDMAERQAVDAPTGDAETERTLVRQNDVLVTIVGAKTGDVCRVPTQLEEHYVCQSVALVRPIFPATVRFIELWLASQENGQAIWKKFIYGQGRPHLSFDQIKAMPVLLPPLAEQARIVTEAERRLSVIDELETVVTANLARATRLRQAILAGAFAAKMV